MASIVNKPTSCTTRSRNLGVPKGCPIKLENITGFFVCQEGFAIPAASQDSFDEVLTYLQTASLDADPNKRLYYVSEFNSFKDSTPASETVQGGMGKPIGRKKNNPLFDIEIPNHGIEYFKNMYGFNDLKEAAFYFVTDEFIAGHYAENGDFVPFGGTMYLDNPVIGSPTGDMTKYPLQIWLDDKDAFSKHIDAIAIPDNIELPDEIGGVTDVTITATGGARTISITAVESISNVDWATKYATEILTHPDMIFILDGVGSEDVKSISNGVILYGDRLPAGTHTVKLVHPIKLIENGLIGSYSKGGYESNEVTVTVTAP